MKNRIYIYVDDLRNCPEDIQKDYPVVTCRSYAATIDMIEFSQEKKWKIFIDLDHDLGEDKTGYDICKYIVENKIKNVEFRIHSANPVGRINMSQLLTHYGYAEF